MKTDPAEPSTELERDSPSRAVSGSARRREVSLGALEPPLTKQLKGLANKDKLALLDQHSRKITWLHLHGLLSDRESDAARKRLMKRIQEAVASPNNQAQVRR